jgi:hypothetical protein
MIIFTVSTPSVLFLSGSSTAIGLLQKFCKHFLLPVRNSSVPPVFNRGKNKTVDDGCLVAAPCRLLKA